MSYYDEVMADGPISYLRLDDSSGFALDEGLNLYGGWFGNAISYSEPSLIIDGVRSWGFDVNDYISTTDQFSGHGFANQYTIEGWYLFDYTPDTSGNGDMGLWDMGSYDSARLTVTTDSGFGNEWQFGSNGENVNFGAVGDAAFDGGPHHIVLVYDATAGTISLYIDGGLVGSDSVSSPAFESFNGNNWCMANFGSWYIVGKADELAVYDYPLDATRIAAHWDAGKPSSGGGGTVALSATIAGVGTFTPAIRARRRNAATIAGTSSITATLRSRARLAAAVAGAGTISAVIRARARVAAAISGVGSIIATLGTSGAIPTDTAIYYNFDESSGTTVLDQSGNGLNGVLNGAASRIAGKVGSGAVRMAGGGGSGVLPDGVQFSRLNLGTVHTVALWVKWLDSGDGVLVGEQSGTYAFYLDSTDVYYSAASAFVTRPHGGIGGGVWTHLAIVRNGGTAQFYKNGAALGAAVTTSNSLAIAYIGGYAFSGGNPFPAQADVDEFRAYTRALSAAEIAALYAYTGAGGGTAALAATIAGVGTLTPVIRSRSRVAATIAGTSAITAALRARVRNAATIAGAGTLAGTLRGKGPLAAAIAGAWTSTATIRARSRMAATLAGVGTLTPTPRVRVRLSATLAGAGGSTVTLRVRSRLSATIAGTSTSTVTLRVRARLGASIAAAGILTASWDSKVSLSAIIAGAGTLAGTIRARQRMTSTVAANGALTSTARARAQVAAVIAGTGSVTVVQPLRARARLAAALVGTAVLTPSLRLRSRLVIAIEGVGVLTSQLHTAPHGSPQPRRAPTGGRIGRPAGGKLERGSAGRIVRAITGRIR